MITSRRDFLKTAGLAAGAVSLPSLPAWITEVVEAEEAAAAAVDKNALAEIALSTARKLGVNYADIRINRYRSEAISTREQQVQNVSRGQNFGFGVRVLFKGTWGFASSRKVEPEDVRRITRQAVEIARANSVYQRKRFSLVPIEKAVTTWKSAFQTDPFDISIDDKIQFLLQLNQAALKTNGVSFVNSSMSFVNEQKFYASTDGSRIEQYIIRTNPNFIVTAVNRANADFQTRSAFGGPQGMGYEYLEKHDWKREAEVAGEEAVAKLTAKPVDPGKYDLVLHPSHLWLTIHESVGHPTELDRSLWWEADYAGTSFLTRDKIGKLQFASKLVNFVADRTQPGGLATVGYDDEGVPAQRWHLVKDGLFVDWQTTRDLAAMTGQKKSYGCCHADSWGSISFPRMPNVSLEPARENAALDDLIAGVEKGVLIYGDGSYSIDQQRYNFQFGGQVFWEIKNGKRGEMLRDVAYQSRTTDFWNSCDGLGGEATYELLGSANDGKGEPGQSNAVSHGCPVARFRQVNVLNTAKR
ncbi:MAG TPA: metallopeptidase TldD-related protein [Pyrinomonadaceae bacterium]|nr:metallopeptidase TldD-related protein [Pyrinomonadaceae bacterium]